MHIKTDKKENKIFSPTEIRNSCRSMVIFEVGNVNHYTTPNLLTDWGIIILSGSVTRWVHLK
jgi:hypothetical protein